ncbi:hypothetical protein ISP15_00085 [Dyella jejuensis]|uniref:Uncharacterized protein n=1 Tax=Dyella jejuensis TaxID=1432009 RepID=A0ABW8JDZ6_9GAMM
MANATPGGLQVRLLFSFDGSGAACKRAVENALGVVFREARPDATGQAYLAAMAMGLEMHLGLPDAGHKGSFSALSLNDVRTQGSGFADISWHFVAIFSGIEGMREVTALA